MCSIKNIKELFAPCIENGCSYLSHSVKYLTAPGENFGSLILSVEVKFTGNNGHTETVHVVAKKIPETPLFQDLFQAPVTFKKELEMYRSIIPTLIEFQRREGMKDVMPFFPKYFNGRLNLAENNHNREVNEDGVIVIENLKLNGYVTCKRKIGFDLDTIKMIIRDLAVFHAVPIALKMKDQQAFKEKLMPHLTKFYIYDYLDDMIKQDDMIAIVGIIKENPKYLHLAARVEAGLKLGVNSNGISASEPFATITHNDCWINNMMLKFIDGKPVKNKFLDFQLIDYGSPGKDLLFLIFSSVQQSVIEKHFDNLIRLYFDKFISTLEELNSDTEAFSFSGLQKELENAAKTSQFFHLMIMLQVVFGDENNAKPLDSIDDFDKMPEPTQEQKETTWFIAQEFAKRNWI